MFEKRNRVRVQHITDVTEQKFYQLAGAHNATVKYLEAFEERYEQLSEEEKYRVNGHLRNIFDILGLEPGQRVKDGDYLAWLKLLSTDVRDHTMRIGRLEKLMEQLLAAFPLVMQDSPSPQTGTLRKVAEVEHENRQVSQTVSQSVSQISQFKPAGRPTDGRVASGEYDEYIRLCRRSKIPVQDIAIELGISKSGVERRITHLKQRGQL